MDHMTIAKMLDTYRPQLVARTVALVSLNPFWVERFGEGFSERMALDADANLAALAKSIRYRSPMMIDDHVRWRRNQIIGFGCATGHVREIFSYKWTAATEIMPAESHPIIYEYIQSSMQALAYPMQVAQDLAAGHEALAASLTAVCFDTNWHWQAAYGVDGRPQVMSDCWFLIDYAIDTIGQNNPDIVGKYVRQWRNTLQRRGLSTVHIQQAIWLATEQAQQQLSPKAASELRRVLDQAATYVLPNRESTQALLAAQDQIVYEVATYLSSVGLAPQPEYAAMEIGWYLAYLNDGVEQADPSGLQNYTRWMQHWFASQGLPDTPLRQSYAAIEGTLERYLPQYAANDARAVLQASQRMM